MKLSAWLQIHSSFMHHSAIRKASMLLFRFTKGPIIYSLDTATAAFSNNKSAHNSASSFKYFALSMSYMDFFPYFFLRFFSVVRSFSSCVYCIWFYKSCKYPQPSRFLRISMKRKFWMRQCQCKHRAKTQTLRLWKSMKFLYSLPTACI